MTHCTKSDMEFSTCSFMFNKFQILDLQVRDGQPVHPSEIALLSSFGSKLWVLSKNFLSLLNDDSDEHTILN